MIYTLLYCMTNKPIHPCFRRKYIDFHKKKLYNYKNFANYSHLLLINSLNFFFDIKMKVKTIQF